MEFYIKFENKLRLLGIIPPLENFQEIVTKVTELENRVDQIQALLEQQN